MAVSMPNIPASGLRVPFARFDVDASQAGYFAQQQRGLVIGQMAAGAEAVAGIPEIVSTDAAGLKHYGLSHLSDMITAYRRRDPFGELWALPLADVAAGVQATGTFTITGPATAAGVITLRIHDEIVQVGVNVGDTATVIGTTMAAAITATPGLLVTAAAVAGVVTLTSRHKGTVGNELTLSVNAGGALAGEAMPGGVTVVVGAMANGAGDPLLPAALANLGDREFDFVILPYTDTTSLNAIKEFFNDTAGRWSWMKMLYGHAFGARRGTLGELVTFGTARNDQHVTVMAMEKSMPTAAHRVAASYGACAAGSIRVDPARPLQTLAMTGVNPAKEVDRFIMSEKQTLLWSGLATQRVANDGTVMIEREATTYQRNAWGQPDPSYLDTTTLFQIMYFIRFIHNRLTTKFPRHKLADDDARFSQGQAIVTPAILRVEIISAYREMERDGIVENGDLFAKYLIVERNAQDPNRIDCLFPPDLVNQLRIIAANVQFRLQYPDAA